MYINFLYSMVQCAIVYCHTYIYLIFSLLFSSCLVHLQFEIGTHIYSIRCIAWYVKIRHQNVSHSIENEWKREKKFLFYKCNNQLYSTRLAISNLTSNKIVFTGICSMTASVTLNGLLEFNDALCIDHTECSKHYLFNLNSFTVKSSFTSRIQHRCSFLYLYFFFFFSFRND